ncbi:MAG: hypothetical protein KC561_09160, partial [Myxococcales bacterium]|nr:hypothetical protein [Myxococcales bacterium]
MTVDSGTLAFSPGQSSKPIAITILGDTIDEIDETFAVRLQNPVDATIGDNPGIGTIDDDDGPTISVADLTVTEGTGGSKTANVVVSLSASSVQTVVVNYSVEVDGGATYPASVSDFGPGTGQLTFTPGQTSQQIPVSIVTDSDDEQNETFLVRLLSSPAPVDATLGDASAVVTIT